MKDEDTGAQVAPIVKLEELPTVKDEDTRAQVAEALIVKLQRGCWRQRTKTQEHKLLLLVLLCPFCEYKPSQ